MLVFEKRPLVPLVRLYLLVVVTIPRKFRLEWEMQSSKREGGKKVMLREKYKRVDRRNVIRIVKKTFRSNFNQLLLFKF